MLEIYNVLIYSFNTKPLGGKMISKKEILFGMILYVTMFAVVSPAIPTAETITVSPYSDEFVILVGTAYDSSTGKLFYLPSNKDGSFGNVSSVGDLGYRSGAGIADFNNDGYLDFVAGARSDTTTVANFYLYNNTGSGNFTQSLIANNLDAGELSDNKVGTFAVADFNNDGYKDFVAPIYKSSHIYLFTNNQNNTFTYSTLTPLSNPFDAKAGDFNEDGKMDFVVTDYFNARVILYKGDGAGGFTVETLFNVYNNYRAADITVGDFNGDGHLDIIVDDFVVGGGGGHLYLGNGNGNFVFNSTVYSRPVNGPSTYGVDSYDFNKDGKLDLILSSYEYEPTGLVFIAIGNGDGTFQSPYQVASGLGSIFPVTPSEATPVPEPSTMLLLGSGLLGLWGFRRKFRK